MRAMPTDFLTLAASDLDAVEAAVLHINSSDAVASAAARLAAIAAAAIEAGWPRTARIAEAAQALIARDQATRPLALRAIMRLRDMLHAIIETDAEPPGDDSDLAAAAADRLPSLVDTLAHARDRLLEISAESRDPRLDAMLRRLAALGAELAEEARAPPEIAAEAPSGIAPEISDGIESGKAAAAPIALRRIP